MMKAILRLALFLGVILSIFVWGAGTVLADEGDTAPPPGSVTVQVSSWQSTYINQSNPSQNYGSASQIAVGSSSYVLDTRALIQFNMPSLPPDAVIDSATLQLQTVFNLQDQPDMATAPPGQYVSTRPILAAWSEGSVTWNSAPAIGTAIDPSTYLAVDAYGVITWNVTNAVAGWVSGSLANYGLMLLSTASGVEVQAFYPNATLSITYLTSTPTATMTRTPTPTLTRTPTRTLTPTPTATSACPLAEIAADRDTYTDSSRPNDIEGLDPRLIVGRDGSDQQYVYLQFPFEGVIPPSEYIYDAKIELTIDSVQGDEAGPWTILAYGLAEPFNEATTRWSTQPAIYGSLGWGEVTDSQYGYIDITAMVRRWHSGEEVNNGIVLVPGGPGDFSASFYSCQQSPAGAFCPRLIIGCGGAPPTATPTRTATHTPTVTLTPSATPTLSKVNVYPFPDNASIEVTQGLQDLQNSVPLLEGKRTFVRFHVTALDTSMDPVMKGYPATALLKVYHNGAHVATLDPINGVPGTPAQIYIKRSPWRSHLYDSYLFEIPTAYLNGTLTLEAEVNPDWTLSETNYWDNEAETTVSFEPAPPKPYFVIYRVEYEKEDGTMSFPSLEDADKVVRWAKMVLPITGAPYALRYVSCPVGFQSPLGDYDCPQFYHPMNVFLHDTYVQDYWDGHSIFDQYGVVRYYGLFDEKGGGLANGIPAAVASGGTNATSTFTHEILHTFGRHHTPACGAETGCWSGFCPDGFEYYPYNWGRISPTTFDYFDTTVFAFDTWGYNNTVYYIRDSTTRDIMSYCIGDRWPGKFTYERILDYLNDHGAVAASTERDALGAADTQYLSVQGVIDPVAGDLAVWPMYTLMAPSTLRPPGGDYAVVLRDSRGAELVRHAFEPESGAADCSSDMGTEDGTRFISEMVRYDARAVQVDIEGPKSVLYTVAAGAAVPEVTVHRPNGGEFEDGETVTVEWSARDTDGDRMTYTVEYSTDNGHSWETVAANVTGTSVDVPSANLPASDRARVRVIATDGIHSGSDMGDSYFTIPNRPPIVEIIEPAGEAHVVVGHNVALVALAYDTDGGSMSGEQITWNSTLDGALGIGDELVTTELDIGAHLITATADDGVGGVGADSVMVYVYGSAEEVPRLPDRLWVNPPELEIHAAGAAGVAQLFLDNSSNPLSEIPWTAHVSDGWIVLGETSGTTPHTLNVAVEPAGLHWGAHEGTITITNDAAPEDAVTVTVYLLLTQVDHFLPFIGK